MERVKELFKIEKNPKKGLLAAEWAMMAYLVFTLLMALLLSTKLPNPEMIIWGRAKIIFMTAALWLVYRIVPCRFTRLVRIGAQMGLLAWWYPDTYEFNRIFPNLDHVFAAWEQDLFGCQPAIVFSQAVTSAVVSEMFDLGYWAYYYMIALVVVYYFGWRYHEFERAAFIVLAAFFIYYLVFIFIPATGPTFYYKAAGLKNIMAGVFPNVHDYFNFHQDCLPAPGYQDGVFYHLVEGAKAAGERPTAAFPSSHIGISTIIMWLLIHARNWRLMWILMPIYICLCCATVYIQAHYLVDAIGGLISGTLLYFILLFCSKNMMTSTNTKKKRR